jgi:drug/metabolite transporter (DMT)-like permease
VIYEKKKLIKPNAVHLSIFIISGILSFFTFLWLRQAQIASPNIGYVNVIVYSSVLITILLTSILFKDKLHPRGLLGAVLIVLGLGLITSIK